MLFPQGTPTFVHIVTHIVQDWDFKHGWHEAGCGCDWGEVHQCEFTNASRLVSKMCPACRVKRRVLNNSQGHPGYPSPVSWVIPRGG